MYGNIPVNEKHLEKSAQWMREYWERRAFQFYTNPRTREMVRRMVEQGAERLSR